MAFQDTMSNVKLPMTVHAPTFGIHVHVAVVTHEDMRFTTALKNLFIKTPAFFQVLQHWHMH